MSTSDQQVLKAIQTIENQLAIIKQAVGQSLSSEPGEVGTFDGEHIVLPDGRSFIIPPNYASKSMLVPGDTLRMVEDPDGGEQRRYKQIAKIERAKADGIVTRKDGKFEVICEEGSFKVLAAAIAHFNAQVGDKLTIQFAKNHTKGSWAAIEKMVSSASGAPIQKMQPAAVQHAETALVSQPAAEPIKSETVEEPATIVESASATTPAPPPTSQPASRSNLSGSAKPVIKSQSAKNQSASASQSLGGPSRNKTKNSSSNKPKVNASSSSNSIDKSVSTSASRGGAATAVNPAPQAANTPGAPTPAAPVASPVIEASDEDDLI